MDSPRVLIFAPSCYPPTGAEAIVTAKLVLAMLEAGWKVKVISQADFGHFYPVADNENWRPLLSVIENIAGIVEKSILGRLLGIKLTNKLRSLFWVIKAVWSGLVSLRKEKYDYLLSRAAPHYGHVPALIVSMFIKIPWIANWSDPLPVKKAPTPYGEGVHAKIPFFLNIYNRMVYRFADWHTLPCQRLMKYYWQIAPGIQEKSSIIPHIALRNFCNQAPQSKDIFSICHSGGLALRPPDIFLKGLKRFINECRPSKTIQVTFIGGATDDIHQLVKEANLENIVKIEKSKTYEDTQFCAASSSVLLVIEAKCDEGVFFPSKFVDFVQTGRPILAISPKEGTLSDILKCHGGGIAADNRSPEEVCKALKILYEVWEMDPLMDDYSSKNLFNLFCAAYVLKKYTEIFTALSLKGTLGQ